MTTAESSPPRDLWEVMRHSRCSFGGRSFAIVGLPDGQRVIVAAGEAGSAAGDLGDPVRRLRVSEDATLLVLPASDVTVHALTRSACPEKGRGWS